MTQEHDQESTYKNPHKIKLQHRTELKKSDLDWGTKRKRARREKLEVWGTWPSELARRNERLSAKQI
jgi:hypothetical protein